MKRPLLAATALLAAGTAMAQSSVQIYGRVNTTVEYQKESGIDRTVLQNNSSRWGLRGTEDLGGGLKASFVLESGFNSDTGAQTQGAGQLFGRESWVGLGSDRFGRVRLGNLASTAAYYATADYISLHNHDTGTSSDAFYNDFGSVRSNAIAYNTPRFGGVVVEAQYSLREGVPGATPSKVLAANYDRGPLHLGIGYVDAAGTLGTATGDSKALAVRALYELGAFKVGGYYQRQEVDSGAIEAKRDVYRLVGMYALGASEFHLNVGFADDIKNVPGDTSAKQYTVGYNYNLSKRTKVYAFYTKVDNDSGANFGPTFAAAKAPGADFSSIALGVRHNF